MEPEAVVRALAAAAREIVTSTLGQEFPADQVALGVQLGGPVDTKAGTVHFFSKHPPGCPSGALGVQMGKLPARPAAAAGNRLPDGHLERRSRIR